MSQHKIDIEKVEYLAATLSAIAHPMRLAIIGLLEERPMYTKEIYTTLQILPAGATHHLTILKNYGLISRTRDGKSCFYTLKKEAHIHILDLVSRCLDV